jgi:hypothetical protein
MDESGFNLFFSSMNKKHYGIEWEEQNILTKEDQREVSG